MEKVELEMWLEQPITKIYIQRIGEEIRDLSEMIGRGSCLNNSSMDSTFASYNQAIGKLAGLTVAEDAEGLLLPLVEDDK